MAKISIYKISSELCEKCYIGSTKNSIHRRFLYHKANYRKYCQGLNSYCSSYEIIDIDMDNCKIELLETCDLEFRKERERYWIRHFDCYNTRRLHTREETNALRRKRRKEKKLKLSMA